LVRGEVLFYIGKRGRYQEKKGHKNLLYRSEIKPEQKLQWGGGRRNLEEGKTDGLWGGKRGPSYQRTSRGKRLISC